VLHENRLYEMASLTRRRDFRLLRKHSNRISGIALLAVLAGGCVRPLVWTDSGLPKALGSAAILERAGASLGIKVQSRSGTEGSGSGSAEVDHEFTATIGPGTVGQLLTALRDEMKHKIEEEGGSIRGRSESKDGAGLTAFGYDYDVAHNRGIVRVHSFAGPSGQVKILVISYEHSQ
jgi:hypothetical protein